MSQVTTGIRSILSMSVVYDAYQRLVGARRHDRLVIADYIRPEPGMRVIDVGCGPASILETLEGVDYCGIDMSEAYINTARERHGDKGTFVAGSADEVAEKYEQQFDVAISLGVLHHLDDEQVRGMFQGIVRLLKPGGRMITVDPCYVEGQSRIAKMFIDNDRGQNVRDLEGYRALAAPYFGSVEQTVREDLLNIPFTQCVMVCR